MIPLNSNNGSKEIILDGEKFEFTLGRPSYKDKSRLVLLNTRLKFRSYKKGDKLIIESYKLEKAKSLHLLIKIFSYELSYLPKSKCNPPTNGVIPIWISMAVDFLLVFFTVQFTLAMCSGKKKKKQKPDPPRPGNLVA